MALRTGSTTGPQIMPAAPLDAIGKRAPKKGTVKIITMFKAKQVISP